MKKTILFPFDVKEDNRKHYCDSLQKAEIENAELVLFTSLPTNADDTEKDEVYLHLLELNGYYQTTVCKWSNSSNTSIRRMICSGDLMQNLSKAIQLTRPNWIVNNNASTYFNQERLGEVLSGSE